MDGPQATLHINALEATIISRFDLARRLVAGRSRVAFLPDETWQHHTFAGYLLASVVSRPPGAVIQIRDAATFVLERPADSLADAELFFDGLLAGAPIFGTLLATQLKEYGFTEPDPRTPRSAHHFERRHGRG